MVGGVVAWWAARLEVTDGGVAEGEGEVGLWLVVKGVDGGA